MKKVLIFLGILMIFLVLALAGGSYYAYQHRQELTKKAISFAMQNVGNSFLAPVATNSDAKQIDNSDLGTLLGMFGGGKNGEISLSNLAQTFMNSLDEQNAAGRGYVSGNDINARDQKGRTLLMNVCRTDASDKVVKMLLQYGADIDAVDDHGRTALMYAVALNKNPAVVRLLVLSGADKKARDYNGKSVFEYAATDDVRAALKR